MYTKQYNLSKYYINKSINNSFLSLFLLNHGKVRYRLFWPPVRYLTLCFSTCSSPSLDLILFIIKSSYATLDSWHVRVGWRTWETGNFVPFIFHFSLSTFQHKIISLVDTITLSSALSGSLCSLLQAIKHYMSNFTKVTQKGIITCYLQAQPDIYLCKDRFSHIKKSPKTWDHWWKCFYF